MILRLFLQPNPQLKVKKYAHFTRFSALRKENISCSFSMEMDFCTIWYGLSQVYCLISDKDAWIQMSFPCYLKSVIDRKLVRRFHHKAFIYGRFYTRRQKMSCVGMHFIKKY